MNLQGKLWSVRRARQLYMDTNDSIARLRKIYAAGELDESHLLADPLEVFMLWMQAALDAGIAEANAMVVATASPSGEPSSRVVLLRGLDQRGFVFYTNYESAKAADLAANPRAALTFWWRELERQVRVTGAVSKVSREESQVYFRSRPRGHRLSAWASPQSRPVPSRASLEYALAEMDLSHPGEDVPLPPFWGGYRVVPEKIEFWQGRANRCHDRFLYTRQAEGWAMSRLAP